MDRLFVPAEFAGLLATMPPASATLTERSRWLNATYRSLREEFPGPRGLVAMRLAGAIRAEIAAVTPAAA